MTEIINEPIPQNGDNNKLIEKYTNQNEEEFDFDNILNFLLRRKKIISFSTALLFIFITIFNIHKRIFNPIYQGSFTLLISDPLNFNNENRASSINNSFIADIARNSSSSDIPTLVQLLQSSVLLKPIAEKYNYKVNDLQRILKITIPQTEFRSSPRVLLVRIYEKNKIKLQSLVEDVSELYLDTALKKRQQRLADGLSFLNKQEPLLQEKAYSLQSELADFRVKNNLLEPNIEANQIKERLVAINEFIFKLNSQKLQLEDVLDGINDGSISTLGFQEAISSGDGNGGLLVNDADQSLLEELIKLKAELAKASSKFLPNSSFIKGLKERINKLEPILRENQIDAVKSATKLNRSKLKTTLIQKEILDKEFLEKPILIKDYQNIKQRLEISEKNFNSLVRAREAFQLEIAQNSLPWQIITPPLVNSQPSYPRVKRNIFFGGILSLFFGLIVGYLRERQDNVFHSPEEIKEVIKYPLLTYVPHIKQMEGLSESESILDLFEDQKLYKTRKEFFTFKFLYQEAFRNLTTQLKFLDTDRKVKVIALTSSLPQEGKSTLSSLLSLTFAELGKNVLLIDSDFRRPKVHKKVGLDNLNGLSNYLIEENNRIDDYIQEVSSHPNFYVITAGKIPPDPNRLLSSVKMKKLISELKENKKFDWVIFDTPPAFGLSDVLLISGNIDGVLLAVSLDKVNKSLPLQSIMKIESSNANILGIICNSVSTNNSPFGTNYYGKYNTKYGYEAYNPISVYSRYGDISEDEREESIAEDLKNEKSKLLKLWMQFRKKINLFFEDF